jgi:hypothetical protein
VNSKPQLKINNIFYQDLASCHKSTVTLKLLQENDIKIFQQVGKGADMSPIEEVFNRLKQLISRNKA